MQKNSGRCNGDFIILHGGAGSVDPKGPLLKKATQDLMAICVLMKTRMPGTNALDLAVFALQSMEENPIFNAGVALVYKNDGQVRVTAALMTGEQQRFSGVINAEEMLHPSLLAKHLQNQNSRVLTQPGVWKEACKIGLTKTDLVTEERKLQWQEMLKAQKTAGCDTVGALVRKDGVFCAGTSTGGVLNVLPGRVSDAATVAGTYASPYAAVSATGVGEEIVDDAVAARMETRVRDGMSLQEACEKTFIEGKSKQRQYGWIALSCDTWAAYFLTDGMPWVAFDLNSGNIHSSESE